MKRKAARHKLFNFLNKDEDNSRRELKAKKKFINLSGQKVKKEEREELKLDFNFVHLINNNDDEIEKREINNIPFTQALRIDKRSFFQIFVSVITNEIGALNLFFYINPYSHFSLTFAIYLFELLLDLTMNCFLYTDEVASEKYHNDGQLTLLTSLSLSLIANIA